MKYVHAFYAAAGVALAGVVAGITTKESMRKAAVRTTVLGMRVSDACTRELQTIIDEASDVRAEAREQAKLDAAVRARLAELEPGIRAELASKYGIAHNETTAACTQVAAEVAPQAAH